MSSLEWSILLPHDKTPEKQERSGQVYGRVKAHDKVWGQRYMLRGVDFWFYLKVLTNSLCFDKNIGKKIAEGEAWRVVKGFAKVCRDEIL